ncbi:MAG: HDOD domain-containing protein, partial [bacterium]
MSLTVAQILEAIMSGAEIPTTAPVMRKLVEMDGEDVPLRQDDIVALVRNDTALTARILRTINPTPHLEEEVLTVEEAISVIPLSHLRNLLLSVKFIDDNPSSHQNEHREAFHLGWLWERNLCTAVAAEVVTSRLKRGDPLQHRTLAVLLHIGTLFLLHNFGDSYRFVIEQWHAGGGNLSELEEDIMGLNHWVVAQQLARAWNLGHKVEEVFKALMEKKDTSVNGIDLRVLTFAETCASILFENNNSTGFERGVQAAQTLLGLDRSRFTDLLQEIALKSDSEMMRYVGVRESGVSYVELLMAINRELGRATLTYEQMVRELEAAMKKAEELAQRLEEANRKLREAASIDPLTKIYNRRYFEEFLSWNFHRAKRYGTTLGCLMIDIDHFKKVNDLYGHLTGDRVLQGVSSALQSRLRNT